MNFRTIVCATLVATIPLFASANAKDLTDANGNLDSLISRHAAANGIDLMISGHTHGGQFFPGTLVAAAVFPFTHGLYHQGPLQVFVSQGAGTYMSRVRLGTSNELNILRLRPTR